MSRRITYVCPVCAGSMLESQAMKEDRLSEVDRLGEAVEFLVEALKRIQTRPAVESAFISAVCLEEVNKRYGLSTYLIAKAQGDNNAAD